MNAATAALISKVIDIALAATTFLQSAGINYDEVRERQAQREAEGGSLTQADRQEFIDQAQAAVDQL